MNSPLPLSLTVPVIILAAAVALLRWRLIHDTPVDRLINRSLGCVAVGLVLHMRRIEIGAAALVHQLSFAAILAALSGIYGLTRLWNGAEPSTARFRQRRYDLVFAVAFALLMATGTPARRRGVMIDQASGWPAVAFWAIFGASLAVCATQLLVLGVRETRAESLSARERILYAALFVAASVILLDAIASPTLIALSTFTDVTALDPPGRGSAVFFATAFVATLVVALPLASRLSARLEWDHDGRHARLLLPLWRDLTRVLPHVALYSETELARRPARVRAHRMTIEIYDALLQLRAYMPPTTVSADTGDEETRTDRYARLVAAALDARTSGAQAQPDAVSHAPRLPSSGSEHHDLSHLARRWRAARLR